MAKSKYRAQKVLACNQCGAQAAEFASLMGGQPGKDEDCPLCEGAGFFVYFASRREFRRFIELLQMERHGNIAALERQPAFPVWINGRKVATYRADFRYLELRDDGTRATVVEDSKGYDPAADKLRRRIAEAYYDMEVRLV